MCEYIIHPLSRLILHDPEFFNKARPELHCLHCFGACDHGPVCGTPVMVQDTKLGSALAREALHIHASTMHIHKCYCDRHCELAVSCTPNLTNLMNAEVYQMGIECLQVIPALPPWTLIEFGGVLTRMQYQEWKVRSGAIAGFGDFSRDCKTNPETALRKMCMLLTPYNRFHKFVFQRETADKIWDTGLAADTQLICWNCSYSLANCIPTTAVLEYDIDTETALECEGLFHDVACKMSYVIRLNGQLTKLRIFWNKHFDSLQFWQGRPLEAHKAPARRLLTKFGGFLSFEEFISPKNPYRLVHEPPVQDFNCYATKNQQGHYVIYEDKLEFNILTLLKTRKPNDPEGQEFKMNGDEYQAGVEYFPKVFHIVQGNRNFRLHFVMMVIPMKVEMKSNEEIMTNYISQAAAQKTHLHKLQRKGLPANIEDVFLDQPLVAAGRSLVPRLETIVE